MYRLEYSPICYFSPTVGLNCLFDPKMTLEHISHMKSALDSAGLSPFLMTQPNCFWTTGCGKGGWTECPEYPLGQLCFMKIKE